MADSRAVISVRGASEHNLKALDVEIERGKITVVTGVSGSGKSSLAFDTILAESQRRFFYTLSNYSRQFLDLGARPMVQQVTGLSPAIALAQNETQPSRRATVGSLTDVSELLGVLFARFGESFCPTHDAPTTAQSPDLICQRILDEHSGATLVVLAPLVDKKKGNFAARLEKIALKGFMRAVIDGKTVPLSPTPVLAKDEKHTIHVVIDQLQVNQKNKDRLRRSLDTAMLETDGFGEYILADSKEGPLDVRKSRRFSSKAGCPECGYSWPKLDSRYFSVNSLGKCTECMGYGETFDDPDAEGDSDGDVESLSMGDLDELDHQCGVCLGTGLNPNLKAVKLLEKSIIDIQSDSILELVSFLSRLGKDQKFRDNPAFSRVLGEISSTVQRIVATGLGYLSLGRRVRSLSGGESQRLKLAGILSDSLHGVLYVLDEPSQGLHELELGDLVTALRQLRDLGNTILVVDHDETIMRSADWIVDLGPSGGARGGQLMARFRPSEAAQFAKQSSTARFLAEHQKATSTTISSKAKLSQPKPTVELMSLLDVKLRNVSIPKVNFRLGSLNVVCGVSGAGKTTLARSVLFENIHSAFEWETQERKGTYRNRGCSKILGADSLDMVWNIDRRPIAKSSVSMPASYLDIFSELRQLYAELPEAQVAGLSQRSFSLSVDGGRCDECRGRGEVNLQMRFLADARVRCDVCQGKRYKAEVLEVRFQDLNMSEVLNLTIDEAAEHFKNFRKIQKFLLPALELGLGYLKLGQPTASLSGGEAQRLKIAPLLAKRLGKGSLLVIDEPTTGLHFEDVSRLIDCIKKLCIQGATLVVIEHNQHMIESADWVIEIGPGAAHLGGKLVYEGDINGFKTNKRSPTARALFQNTRE